jgi:hypothetical protein
MRANPLGLSCSKKATRGKTTTKLLVAMTGKASAAKAAEGDEPVFAYIASLPQPQREIAERIDALAAKTLPGLQRAVKWGMAYYGVDGGWCFTCGGFVGHVKLMFIRGTEIKPEPPVTPIIDAKSVSLQLLAMVNMNANEPYEKCDVTLVLNNAVSVEKLSGSTFKLSSFDLYPHRNITYNLREWNAYAGKDEVHVLLQVKNPFSVDLNQTSSSVEANQIIVESGIISNQSGVGEVVSLPAGIDDTISTFRSVKITEATDRTASWPGPAPCRRRPAALRSPPRHRGWHGQDRGRPASRGGRAGLGLAESRRDATRS